MKGFVQSVALVAVVLVAVLGAPQVALDGGVERVAMEGGHVGTGVPHGWTHTGERVAADAVLRLTFALTQRNTAELERRFWAVSDPANAEYANYMRVGDIAALVAPEEETLAHVQAALRRAGAQGCEVTLSRDFVTCDFARDAAEALLGGVAFHKYAHGESKMVLARALGAYTLPRALADVVDFVGGVNRLPSHGVAPQVDASSVSSGALAITPRVIRSHYKIGDFLGSASSNKQAVASFLKQYISTVDLSEFFTMFYPKARAKVTVVGKNGPLPGTEAELDVQTITTTGGLVPTEVWNNAGLHDNQEPFLQWITQVSNTENAPLLFSVSYGDVESSLSIAYLTRVNVEFQKAGLRGISLIVASGDSGSGCNANGTQFSPNFPASSPYVTTVGGTMMDGLLESGHEVTNSLSGGGFSNVFSQPAYQETAVHAYLNNQASHLPPASFYNATGRAYPDVACFSSNFVIVHDLLVMPGVSGTSCATPTFSGVIGLLNDIRIKAGKASLGFLNPMLYKHAPAGAFGDVQKDCSGGCQEQLGFCAGNGWDPATGHGSPRFDVLSKFVLTL